MHGRHPPHWRIYWSVTRRTRGSPTPRGAPCAALSSPTSTPASQSSLSAASPRWPSGRRGRHGWPRPSSTSTPDAATGPSPARVDLLGGHTMPVHGRSSVHRSKRSHIPDGSSTEATRSSVKGPRSCALVRFAFSFVHRQTAGHVCFEVLRVLGLPRHREGVALPRATHQSRSPTLTPAERSARPVNGALAPASAQSMGLAASVDIHVKPDSKAPIQGSERDGVQLRLRMAKPLIRWLIGGTPLARGP